MKSGSPFKMISNNFLHFLHNDLQLLLKVFQEAVVAVATFWAGEWVYRTWNNNKCKILTFSFIKNNFDFSSH